MNEKLSPGKLDSWTDFPWLVFKINALRKYGSASVLEDGKVFYKPYVHKYCKSTISAKLCRKHGRAAEPRTGAQTGFCAGDPDDGLYPPQKILRSFFSSRTCLCHGGTSLFLPWTPMLEQGKKTQVLRPQSMPAKPPSGTLGTYLSFIQADGTCMPLRAHFTRDFTSALTEWKILAAWQTATALGIGKSRAGNNHPVLGKASPGHLLPAAWRGGQSPGLQAAILPSSWEVNEIWVSQTLVRGSNCKVILHKSSMSCPQGSWQWCFCENNPACVWSMSDGSGQEHFVQDPGWARASSPPQGTFVPGRGSSRSPKPAPPARGKPPNWELRGLCSQV